MAKYEPYKMQYRMIPSTGVHELDVTLGILLSMHDNESCFDCGKENPTMASLALGVWICDGCADIHADFKSPFNYVRPIFFPDWPPPKLARMIVGGNHEARVFFEKFGWTGGRDLEAKYTSQVAKLYRKTLSAKVLNSYYNDLSERALAHPSGSDITAFIAWSKAYDSKFKAKVSKTKCATTSSIPETSPAISSPDLSGCRANEPPPTCSVHDMVDQETDEARKRFPNAKSISSAQFFGDQENMDDTESKLCLHKSKNMDDTESKLCLHKSKSMNSTSIFSADLFGLTSKEPSKISV